MKITACFTHVFLSDTRDSEDYEGVRDDSRSRKPSTSRTDVKIGGAK